MLEGGVSAIAFFTMATCFGLTEVLPSMRSKTRKHSFPHRHYRQQLQLQQRAQVGPHGEPFTTSSAHNDHDSISIAGGSGGGFSLERNAYETNCW